MAILPEFYANNPTTSLSANITNVATTLTVASASAFPANAQFRILVDQEIMIVTAGAGTTTWTVTRGQEGTANVSHLSGAAVSGLLTKGSLSRCTNMVNIYGCKEYGRPYIAQGQYQSVANGATYTLLDTSGSNPNTAGYIDHIWIGTLSSPSYRAHQESDVKIYLNGSGSPDCTFKWGGPTLAPFLGTGGAGFDGGRFGLSTLGANDAGGYFKVKIPFDTSIKVTITNNDTGSAQFFWDISYKLTPTFNIDWGRAKHFQISEVWNTTVTAYANQTLANVSGRGLIHGWSCVFHSNSGNFNFLEGDPQIKIDGEITPSMKWSGTEDLFLNAGYFASGKQCTEDHGTGFYDGAGHNVGAYRLWLDDPIPFDTSFNFVWPAGDISQAVVSSGPTIFSEVYYYLDT